MSLKCLKLWYAFGVSSLIKKSLFEIAIILAGEIRKIPQL